VRNLGVRQFTTLHGGTDARQRRQGTSDTHLLASSSEIDAGPPMQPVSTRQTAVVPTGAVIEVAKHDEQFVRRGVQTRGQGGDRVAELNDVTLALGGRRHQPIASRFSGDER
jgi:hypothetical protein